MSFLLLSSCKFLAILTVLSFLFDFLMVIASCRLFIFESIDLQSPDVKKYINIKKHSMQVVVFLFLHPSRESATTNTISPLYATFFSFEI